MLVSSNILIAEEKPVDIWDLEKKKEENNFSTSNNENSDSEESAIEIKETELINTSNIINSDFSQFRI